MSWQEKSFHTEELSDLRHALASSVRDGGLQRGQGCGHAGGRSGPQQVVLKVPYRCQSHEALAILQEHSAQHCAVRFKGPAYKQHFFDTFQSQSPTARACEAEQVWNLKLRGGGSPENRRRQLLQDASGAENEQQGVMAELLGCQLLRHLTAAHRLTPVLGQHVCYPAQAAWTFLSTHITVPCNSREVSVQP